ncbi:NAD(H) kinase 1-like [Juglans microcarpa x Juglans regia]|uniref:NAD(H) kinase 1-like n=1 Tax=Juglans microcarpa x Juglans regia TaxID=2249226 RepID=UPI001B7F3528|nr:NAD(H) kinase 1-like [Juglans microcarpa x Juglans regia]
MLKLGLKSHEGAKTNGGNGDVRRKRDMRRSTAADRGRSKCQTRENREGEASISCSLPENGVSNSYSLFSEKAVDELLQSPVQGSDDHLVELSEVLRTVAKALRRAAEGKASVQAEAAEWKRKYDLERARNLQMECKEHGSDDVDDARMGNLVNQPVWCSEANEQLEK